MQQCPIYIRNHLKAFLFKYDIIRLLFWKLIIFVSVQKLIAFYQRKINRNFVIKSLVAQKIQKNDNIFHMTREDFRVISQMSLQQNGVLIFEFKPIQSSLFFAGIECIYIITPTFNTKCILSGAINLIYYQNRPLKFTAVYDNIAIGIISKFLISNIG